MVIRNKLMVTAGVATLIQAMIQMFACSLAIAQYFCVIDFLIELPFLLYIRILYFHNPSPCGVRIHIGQAIDGIADQAFVLLTEVSIPAFRTFVINCVYLGLSIPWIFASIVLIMGGAKANLAKSTRWPWIIITVIICGLDLVATVTYCNDTFHTRTLSDIMEFVNGMASGIGGTNLDTTWAAWTMVIIYSRLIVLFFLNLFLVISVIVDYNAERLIDVDTGIQVNFPSISDGSNSDKDIETASVPSHSTKIPRPGLSRSFRRMKELLFRKSSPPLVRCASNPESLNATPERISKMTIGEEEMPKETCQYRSPRTQHVEVDKKRTVNFPENLLSLPQRLENLIAEQQRRLDKAVINTAGRSPPSTSQSMPQLNHPSNHDAKGRRSTAAELQRQLPWAYVPASFHRMRDQLPPDEDLPPVPLPDYTAIQPFRKASVHRAASSLSSLTQKRDAIAQSRPTLSHSDVLY